jgi:hypothetical protein
MDKIRPTEFGAIMREQGASLIESRTVVAIAAMAQEQAWRT